MVSISNLEAFFESLAEDAAERAAEKLFQKLRPFVEQACQPAPDPRPLTKKEAARYLGVSLATFTTRENEGKVQGFRNGSRRLYRREDLDASLIPVRRTAA